MKSSHPVPFYLKNFRKLVLKNGLVRYASHGVRIYLRPRTMDGYIFNEVFINNDYQPVHATLPDNPLVVDLGAQIGVFSVWAHVNFDQPRIIAIEPFADNVELLRKNLEENGVEHTIIEKALYKDNQPIGLKVSKTNSGGHRLHEAAELQIAGATFPAMLGKNTHVDYLKVDIEGSEQYFFDEPNKTFLRDNVAVIKMEVHKKHVKLATIKVELEALGFQVFVMQQPYLKNKFIVVIEAVKQTD